ncbi:MAG: Ig-like domain repeat protein [Acidobacteriota bacterium]
MLIASAVANGQAITRAQIINTVLSSGAGATGTAQLNNPYGVALDGAGNLYVADGSNNVIRKVTPAGTSSIVAGTLGVACASGKNLCGDNSAATSAQLSLPVNTVVDAQGNLYIADRADNRVRLVNATTGVITTIAGTGTICSNGTATTAPCGDSGLATAAQLSGPSGLALDTAGNLYIADTGDNRVRKVVIGTGVISTIAGSGTAGYDHDNVPGTTAELNAPYAVAADLSGNVYIADRANNRIREVAAGTGIITTVAGTGTDGYDTDNQLATSAALSGPFGVGTDSVGNVYVTDTGNNRIREVAVATGVITTVAGNGKLCTVALDALAIAPCGDGGLATSALLHSPYGTVVDPIGNLYIADRANERVRVVNTTLGNVLFPATALGASSTAVTISLLINTAGTTINSITVAGSQGGSQEYVVSAPSLPSNASAGTIYSFTVTFTPAYPGVRAVPLQVNSSAGTFVLGLAGTGVGPEVALTPGTISALAGTGTAGYSGDGGAAVGAQLHAPSKETIDSAGNLYVADTANNVIREISASGVITTFAGTGVQGYSGDTGLASAAKLNQPGGVAIDAAGNLYIADTANNVIREVSAAGVITTVAGTGAAGYSGDGRSGISAKLNAPSGIAVDALGNLYIADTGNNVIRELTVLGTITTIAGTGNPGYSGDNGLPTVAQLRAPTAVVVDGTGNVVFADTGNSVVREVTPLGVVKTIAGTGIPGSSGDNGLAISAQLSAPSAVAVDSGGDVYIADAVGARIRRITAATGVISTVAGDGATGSAGDNGPANAAEFSGPTGIALDGLGKLFVADTNNQSIRVINVQASSLTFADSTVGVKSSDSPQSLLVSNVGNSILTFTPPASGQNPSSSSASFSVANTSTCPILTSASSTATLGAGNSCTLQLNFTPTAAGPLNGTVSLADNALNVTGAQQVVHVRNNAFATQPVNTTTTVTVTTPSYGKTQVAAQIAPVTGTLIASGTVVFSIDNVAQSAVAVGGTGAATLPAATAVAIGAGTHTISAAYTSNSSKLAGSSGSTSATISVASTTLNVSASLSVVAQGAPITLTATANTLVPEAPTGQVTFLANNVAVGTATLAGGVATLVTTVLPAGTDAITAVYSGDTNFTGSSATAVTVTVIVPNFSMTASPTYLMVSAGGSGTSTLTLSAVNTFGGPVTFTVSGLPAGASASFSPATVTVPVNGTASTAVTLTAGKQQADLQMPAERREGARMRYALLLFPLLMGLYKRRGRRSSLASRIALVGVLGLLPLFVGLMGCGKAEQAPVSYNVSVIAKSGNIQQSTSIIFMVE